MEKGTDVEVLLFMYGNVMTPGRNEVKAFFLFAHHDKIVGLHIEQYMSSDGT